MQRRIWIGLLVLVLAGAGAWRAWRKAGVVAVPEPAPWRLVMDEAYQGSLGDYRTRWDHLAQPMDGGQGFAPRAWPHISIPKEPRSPMRVEARLAPSLSRRGRWLQLMLASAAEYYETSTSSGGKLPRSRVAAAFGRLEVNGDRMTLSVGQVGLNGQETRVVSAGFAWAPAQAQEPLLLELDGDRLTLSFGAHGISTLADQVLPGSDEFLRVALNGERIQVARLRWEARPQDPAEATLAQADKYLALGRLEACMPLLDELLAQSRTARVSMRKATAEALLGRTQEAQAIYRGLLGPDQDRFYGAYAAVALAQLERKAGRPLLELERDLASWTNSYQGHPAQDQARLLRARLIGESLGTGTAYQQLAAQVLVGRDPAAAREALAMLSEGPLAIQPEALMEILQTAQAESADLGQSLLEAITTKQAALQAQNGDLKGLLATARASRWQSYANRDGIYAHLAAALQAAEPRRAKQVLAEAAGEGTFLRDFLFMRGYPLARHPSRRDQRPPVEEEVRGLLQASLALGGGRAKTGAERAFYHDLSGTAISYGQVPQAPPTLNGDTLCLDFKSGSYWGCGLAIHPQGESLLEKGAIDLSGLRRLRAKVKAPKGVEYFLMLSESGCGPSSADSFDGEAGADGEQALLPVQLGTGDWQELNLELASATPVLAWGNLEGNFKLDLQAIQKVDLAIPGSQGDGSICLKDLRFSGR